MMTINVTKYRLNPDRVFAGTRGSYGMEKLSFNFDDGWDFDTISVTFHPQRGKPIRVPYLAGAEIDIPAEVMAYSGESRFVVSGTILGDNGGVERKAITLEGFVDVAYTADDKGGNARKVTPDVYDQLIDQATGIFNAVREDAERSASEAAESASDAERSASEAAESASDAEGFAKQAETLKDEAVGAAGTAHGGASVAEKAAAEAQASERAAKTSEENASVSAVSAGKFADSASDAAVAATVAQEAAEAARRAAGSSATLASNEADRAEQTVKETLREAMESGEFDGENGITPHIGENGNWWIGDEDTGVQAQGKSGEDYILTEADKQEIAEMIPAELNPVDKTEAMTQPVGRDEQGRLWTQEGGATAFVEVPVSTGSADEYVFDDGWTADAVVAEIDAGRMVILVDGSTPYYYGGYFSKVSGTLQFINNSAESHRRLYLRGDTLSYARIPYSKSVTEYIQCYTSDGVWKSALTFDEIQELVDNEIRCVVFIEYSDGSRREYHYAGIAEGTMHVFVYAYANIIYMVKIHQDGTVESSLSNLVPRTRTINGKPLSANITLNASDVGAVATVNGAEPDENGDVTVRELPKYAEADEGKVLSVVDGVLAWADAPSGGGGINVTYDETTGDLTITSSSGGVAFDETTGNLTIGG